MKSENYASLRVVLDCYDYVTVNLKDRIEEIGDSSVISESLARFELEQAFEKKKWLEQEIDRLIKE